LGAAVERGLRVRKLKTALLEAVTREWLVKTQQAGSVYSHFILRDNIYEENIFGTLVIKCKGRIN
jgi:hypothetical protein